MPGSFAHEEEFLEGRTVLRFTIPAGLNPRDLDVLITPLYVSVSIHPSHVTVLDLEEPVDLVEHSCKYKRGVLTVELFNARTNRLHVSPDESETIKRRNQSFFKYQEHEKELSQKRDEEQARAAHAASDVALHQQMAERDAMRARKEAEISELKRDVVALSEGVSAQNALQPIQTAHPDAPAALSAIRSRETVSLVAEFTRRKMAVPARDGRDIYCDEAIGPIVPEITTRTDTEQLAQARRYLCQKKPDFESAIGVLEKLLQQQPLHMKALLLLAQALLRQGRADQCLQISAQLVKVIQGKHELQDKAAGQTFAPQTQAQVYAIHGAALACAGKYSDAFRYTDSALAIDKNNEALRRDWTLLQRVVLAIAE